RSQECSSPAWSRPSSRTTGVIDEWSRGRRPRWWRSRSSACVPAVWSTPTTSSWRSCWGRCRRRSPTPARRDGHGAPSPAASSRPGNWGYGVTAPAVVVAAWVLVRGTRPQRLTAAAVIPLFALVGTSRVRFPHYVLVVVPLLACLGMVALVRLARRAGVAGGV